jgi:hypothetical protein
MVPTEVVGNRIEPSTEVATFVIGFASSIESQESVVHKVGCQVGIVAKPSDEETLQPSGITVVEFLEGTIAAT